MESKNTHAAPDTENSDLSGHFKNTGDTLRALNNHFKTVTLERYQDAILNFTEDEAIKKVIGHSNKKVSKRAANRVRDALLKKLREHYGCWINIYDWEKGSYTTNFDCTYKTSYGRLYGYKPRTVFDHVFFTTHCFEQFDARTEDYPFGLIELAFKNVRNTIATKADILRFLLLSVEEYCDTIESVYVNVGVGIVVFDKLSHGLLIAKTFLLPDMTYPQKGWRKTHVGGFILDRTVAGTSFVKDKDKPVPIPEPNFYDPCDVPYAYIESMMKIRCELVVVV